MKQISPIIFENGLNIEHFSCNILILASGSYKNFEPLSRVKFKLVFCSCKAPLWPAFHVTILTFSYSKVASIIWQKVCFFRYPLKHLTFDNLWSLRKLRITFHLFLYLEILLHWNILVGSWKYSCVEEYIITFYKRTFLKYSLLLTVLPRNWLDANGFCLNIFLSCMFSCTAFPVLSSICHIFNIIRYV